MKIHDNFSPKSHTPSFDFMLVFCIVCVCVYVCVCVVCVCVCMSFDVLILN